MTFIYPRQCYSTNASGAEQTAETKNPNWPETNQLALPSTHIWIGCGADISLVCLFFLLDLLAHCILLKLPLSLEFSVLFLPLW